MIYSGAVMAAPRVLHGVSGRSPQSHAYGPGVDSCSHRTCVRDRIVVMGDAGGLCAVRPEVDLCSLRTCIRDRIVVMGDAGGQHLSPGWSRLHFALAPLIASGD